MLHTIQHAPLRAPARLHWLHRRAWLRVLTALTTVLVLSLLLSLTRLVLPWPAVSPLSRLLPVLPVPMVQAASGNAITWQTPLSGQSAPGRL